MLAHLKLEMNCLQEVIEIKQPNGCHCTEIERQTLGSLQKGQCIGPFISGTECATYRLLLCPCQRDKRVISIRVVPLSEDVKRRRHRVVPCAHFHFGTSLFFQDLEHSIDALPHLLFGGPKMHRLDELRIGKVKLPLIAAQVECPNVLGHDLTDDALPVHEAGRENKLIADLLPQQFL